MTYLNVAGTRTVIATILYTQVSTQRAATMGGRSKKKRPRKENEEKPSCLEMFKIKRVFLIPRISSDLQLAPQRKDLPLA